MSLLEALRQIEARSRQSRPSTTREPSTQLADVPAEPEYLSPSLAPSDFCYELTSQPTGVLDLPADERLLSSSTICAPEDDSFGTLDSLMAATVGDELTADLPVDVSDNVPDELQEELPITLPFTSGSQVPTFPSDSPTPAWEPAVDIPTRELPSPSERGAGEEPAEKQPYQELAERIAGQLSPGRPTVLMFTSPEDGAGKTQMLSSLASALLDQRSGEMLAVDANLRNPELAGHFGLEPARGLNDLLLGTATSRELVRSTPLPRLSLLPAVKAYSHEDHLPTDFDFGPLLEELTATYPLVLIDAPSLAHPETAAIGRHCDGVYLVVRLGHTSRRALRDAVRVIQRSGGRLLGCVVIDG